MIVCATCLDLLTETVAGVETDAEPPWPPTPTVLYAHVRRENDGHRPVPVKA